MEGNTGEAVSDGSVVATAEVGEVVAARVEGLFETTLLRPFETTPF